MVMGACGNIGNIGGYNWGLPWMRGGAGSGGIFCCMGLERKGGLEKERMQ